MNETKRTARNRTSSTFLMAAQASARWSRARLQHGENYPTTLAAQAEYEAALAV